MANQPKAPAGYTSQSSDIVGFWDSEEGPPIHMLPRFCRMFDSKIDPKKISTLIIVELIDDPETQAQMGQLGAQRLRSSLSWESQVPRLIAAYKRAATKRKRR